MYRVGNVSDYSDKNLRIISEEKMKKQSPEELMKYFSMEEHPENGQFVEKHYVNEGEDRAASGSIYYYVAPGEKTAFHRIDCDEYWCYVAGNTLDLWQVSPEGEISVVKLGIEEGAEPFVYVKKGMSARGLNKVLKVARTIADYENSDSIRRGDLCEAISYRSIEEKYWNGGEVYAADKFITARV